VIAADTSTWVAFLGGEPGEDVQTLGRGLTDRHVVMIPVVLTELLSDPEISSTAASLLVDVPLTELRPGYWQRAGLLRAKVIGRGRRARLGDALIAQCCIDEDVPLVTRDRDFKAFSEAGGLHLPVPF
jgi:predicted nucleic acid-binding protein